MNRLTFKVATFDCYGTLIDWEGGAASFLYDLARRHERPDPPPGASCASAGRRSSSSASRATTRLPRGARRSASPSGRASAGTAGTSNDGEALARAMQSWQPFPDTVPALARARRPGSGCVIISNTDRTSWSTRCGSSRSDFDGGDRGRGRAGLQARRRPLPPRRSARSASTATRSSTWRSASSTTSRPAQRHGHGTAWVNRHREPAPGRSGRTTSGATCGRSWSVADAAGEPA